ncbi:hypothetical protein HOP50_16g76620 [Chloropicon primus]|uniref:Transmembrane protein 138 n=1 Tax=Chloropicon primus TaxID=1764295 RepID=A0A5B8MZN1_9CHLO|nr:hypothetical protein A3770_16p76330 [Chloropicon primus]UPR04324.1 hypothetical protein HOP50_16g76620 [Chloropicon primus]|eukprot:QDZ25115.1 hypothetical protein A3770_16p76330 [Chloropicon primus]
MGALTHWVSRRTRVKEAEGEGDGEDTPGTSASTSAKEITKPKLKPKPKPKAKAKPVGEGGGSEREEEGGEGRSPDEVWLSTQGKRRHPLGFVLASSEAYALEPTKNSRWLAEQNSIRFKMWPVFLSVLVDLLTNAYTEPVYSNKRTVHALVFSCQICTLLLTVTSFVVLVGGDSASLTQADYYVRVFSENKAMLFFCLLNVLVMCTCRIMKLILLFENYPHAAITQHLPYRFLYGTHQVVSTLYYITLFQSVLSVCKHYCMNDPAKSKGNKV